MDMFFFTLVEEIIFAFFSTVLDVISLAFAGFFGPA